MAYRIIIITLLAAVLFLLCWVIRLHRRLDHAERELDIALRDGKRPKVKDTDLKKLEDAMSKFLRTTQ